MVPSPVIDHEWVTVPPAGNTVEVWVLVVPPQNGPGLLIEQVGFGFTVTVNEQVPGQPLRVVLSVTV